MQPFKMEFVTFDVLGWNFVRATSLTFIEDVNM